MRRHEFTLILKGSLELTEEIADALFEAGCDDGTAGTCNKASTSRPLFRTCDHTPGQPAAPTLVVELRQESPRYLALGYPGSTVADQHHKHRPKAENPPGRGDADADDNQLENCAHHRILQ